MRLRGENMGVDLIVASVSIKKKSPNERVLDKDDWVGKDREKKMLSALKTAKINPKDFAGFFENKSGEKPPNGVEEIRVVAGGAIGDFFALRGSRLVSCFDYPERAILFSASESWGDVSDDVQIISNFRGLPDWLLKTGGFDVVSWG
jgi:hypothetical protein